jgi:hypothetical protein
LPLQVPPSTLFTSKQRVRICCCNNFSSADPKALIETIKQNKMKVGLALKPKTKVETVVPYLDMVDLILVMVGCLDPTQFPARPSNLDLEVNHLWWI